MGSSVVHLNIPGKFLAGTVAYPEELEEVCIGRKGQGDLRGVRHHL